MASTSPIRGFADRLRGTYTIVRALPGQRRVPFLPAEAVARRRDERVRALVTYAAEHVPHYRDLFRREEIDPAEIRSADDLSRLPFLDKAEFQEAPERFRPRRQSDDYVVLRTAGSTGQPVEVVRDRRSLLESIAYDERERAVESHLCGRRWRYEVAQISNPVGNLLRIRAAYAQKSFRPFRPRLHVLSIAERPERLLEEIDRIRPSVIRGHGGYVELLFRTAHARGVAVRGPKVASYGADDMSAEGRRLVEEDFGIPVISRYGAAEATKIGFVCELRTGFHLHEDLTHLTIVRADGSRAEPGERGEVVVTDLLNRGTVLVNYRLGDLAAVLPDACGCGRSLRLLSALDGRLGVVVRLADGAAVHHRLLESPVQRHPGVLRFQVVQVERDRFDLRVVTVDEAAYRRVVDRVVADLRDVLHGADVRAERCDELSDGDRVKFRTVVPLGDGR